MTYDKHVSVPEVDPDDELLVSNSTMIFTKGRSNPSFHCNCGGNLFRSFKANPLRFKCNSCGVTYTGEA